MSDAVSCDEWGLLIQAELDGELDIAGIARLARHVEICPACAALQRDFRALSSRIKAELPREAGPEHIIAPLRAAARFGGRTIMPLFASFSAGLALAASLAWVMLLPADPNAELVAGHIRALQPGHLTDVLSADSHTVKPWFDGRIDYAPEVRDFAAEGFPLVGGRLDYIGGRTVAALVYHRDKHLIDLYAWPAAGHAAPSISSDKGYTLVRWTEGGMAYVAVSDVNPIELQAFARLWAGGAGKTL